MPRIELVVETEDIDVAEVAIAAIKDLAGSISAGAAGYGVKVSMSVDGSDEWERNDG